MILFKFFERYNISTFQAIIINYWVCVLTGMLTMPTESPLTALQTIPSQNWIPFALALGFIFITGFQIIGFTAQKCGITATTIANKTTMVMPVTVALLFYGDTATAPKIIGIICAVVAVLFTSYREEKNKDATQFDFHYIALPIIVFILGGIIEVLLNYVSRFYAPDNALFSISIFAIAGTLGTIMLLVQLLRKRTTLQAKNLVGGIILGIPNYFSIYWLLLALQQSGLQSSILFPLANISVVLLSALLARVLFDEKLNLYNKIGVSLALFAIVLMML